MTRTRVNELDLLRFVAALMVVCFHYAFRGYAADAKTIMPYPLLAPVGKYGYLGVDLFFMISGFVILMTAASGSLRDFVVSRAARLYPAFWVCCTITFAAILAIGGLRYHAGYGQYLVNMTMLAEFFHVPYVDGAYWSLTVELRFYAIVALVLLLGQIHRAQALLCLWMVALIVVVALPNYWLRYLLAADYGAYFIAGATCFLVWSQGISALRIGLLVAAWAVAVFQALWLARGNAGYYHTTFDLFVVAGIVTAWFAIMLLVALRRTGLLGERRWLTIGALTYPLYLLHQNIGFMIFNLGYPAIDAHLLFWGTIAAMLVLSHLVNTQVERRIAPRLKAALNRGFDAVAGTLSRSAIRTRA